MAGTLKTSRNEGDIHAFLNSVENEQRRNDAKEIYKVMERLSGEEGKMWGASIIGFSSYHFVYASGKEGDWMRIGFSPRKQSLTLYIMNGFKHYDDLLGRLGKHKTGKSCLYINKLSDIDMRVLEELISSSLHYIQEKYPL